jgi:hypothetical protein
MARVVRSRSRTRRACGAVPSRAVRTRLELLNQSGINREGSLDAPRQQSVPIAVVRVHRTKNWHQTGTSQAQKAKKSAGANLLTLAFLGSPTWARTRDLRINSPALYRLSYRGIKPASIAWLVARSTERLASKNARFWALMGTSRHGQTGKALLSRRGDRWRCLRPRAR